MKSNINSPSRLGDKLEEMDKEIREWSKVTRQTLVKRILSLNLREKARLQAAEKPTTKAARRRQAEQGPLHKSVRNYLKKRQGEIEKVAFSFARKGIWLEHGVGRGRPVRSPQALAAARPWLGDTLEDATEELATLLEENYADIAASELRILVPGIVDTRVGNMKYPEYLEFEDAQGPIRVMIDPSFF